jgi:hypothetical protein
MEDREVPGHMGELVNGEHERLRQLEVNLEDQWWDLLGQRGALREGDYDPDEAKVRDQKRKDRRRLPALTPQPGCVALGRSLA